MYVTNGLAQVTYEVSVKYVENQVKAKQHEIRNAIDNLQLDDDKILVQEATAELVNKYKDISDSETIRKTCGSKYQELIHKLMGKKVDLPPKPVPPLRKDVWELVVIKNDKDNFNKHMDACVKQTLNAVRFLVPGAEFARIEDFKDPHMQGLWCLDRNRYPDACCWEETLANIQEDIDRVKNGWSVDPLQWAAECRDIRITACAEVLGITKNDFSNIIPPDLEEYWSTHHDIA